MLAHIPTTKNYMVVLMLGVIVRVRKTGRML